MNGKDFDSDQDKIKRTLILVLIPVVELSQAIRCYSNK